MSPIIDFTLSTDSHEQKTIKLNAMLNAANDAIAAREQDIKALQKENYELIRQLGQASDVLTNVLIQAESKYLETPFYTNSVYFSCPEQEELSRARAETSYRRSKSRAEGKVLNWNDAMRDKV